MSAEGVAEDHRACDGKDRRRHGLGDGTLVEKNKKETRSERKERRRKGVV